jgi:geranylgeranyl diphosphate synthase type II
VGQLLLPEFSKVYKNLLEEQIRVRINQLNTPSVLKESMLYSLEAGGKRIRPLLLFATLRAFRQKPEKGLLTAMAIEVIHTYSLIHDDLPSMDNDDLRRGKPTNHKVFGDALAVLAGDALLTYGFQLIGETSNDDASPEIKLQLICEFAKAAGAEGMVGGQVADINGEGKNLTLEELEYIHVHKTGKLLEFSVVAGAIIAGATLTQIQDLAKFASHLGLAFQIRDDILDLEGSEDKIGKTVGSDEHNHKNTYPSLLSMNGAKKALGQEIENAKAALLTTGLKTDILEEITNLVASRDH